MDRLGSHWRKDTFPARRTFDLVLALTLQAQGVFEDLELFTVTDPLA